MPKAKILIVDDDVTLTKLLKSVLERSGRYQVQYVNEGTKAISIAKVFGPDLVVLDVTMPDADGTEISLAMENDAAFKKTPIIFLTGSITHADEQSGMTISGHPAMSKPIQMEKLVGCIERNLADR